MCLIKIANETKEQVQMRAGKNINDLTNEFMNVVGDSRTESGKKKLSRTMVSPTRFIVGYDKSSFKDALDESPKLSNIFDRSVAADREVMDFYPEESRPQEINRMERIQGDNYVRDRGLLGGIIGGAGGGVAGKALGRGNKRTALLGAGASAVGGLVGAGISKGIQSKDRKDQIERLEDFDQKEGYAPTNELVQRRMIGDIYDHNDY